MTLEFNQQLGPAGPVDSPVLLADDTVTLVNGVSHQTAVLDMRAFNSYHLAVGLGNGTFNDTDMVEIEAYHFDIIDQAANDPKTWADQWYLYRETLEAERMFQDAVRGGFMYLRFATVPATARTCEMRMRLWGSYRSVPQLGIRNSLSFGIQGTNVLFDNTHSFGGVETEVGNVKIGVGKARLRLENTGAAGVSMFVEYGGVISGLRDSAYASGGEVIEKDIILPTRQARVSLESEGATDIRASIIQDRITQ